MKNVEGDKRMCNVSKIKESTLVGKEENSNTIIHNIKMSTIHRPINLSELIVFSEKNIEYLEITHKIELKDLEFLKKKYDISCKWHPNYYYLGGQLKVFKDEQITDKLIHEAEKAVKLIDFPEKGHIADVAAAERCAKAFRIFKQIFDFYKYSDYYINLQMKILTGKEENSNTIIHNVKMSTIHRPINLSELIVFSEKNIEYLEITHKIELKDLEFLKKKYDISCKWHPNYYYLGGQLKVFKDEQITDKLIHEAEKAVKLIDFPEKGHIADVAAAERCAKAFRIFKQIFDFYKYSDYYINLQMKILT